MATATMPRATAGTSIKLEYGVAQVFALRFNQGKNVQGIYGPRVMFTTIDERKLWLDPEDGSDLERSLNEMGVRAGVDFVRVTKIKHPRGGGHSIRVERMDDDAPPVRRPVRPETESRGPSREEALLEKSLELARDRGNGAFISQPAAQAPESTPPGSAKGSMTKLLAASLMASIDAYVLVTEYARSKGIPVELTLRFTAEDVRQSSTSMLIQHWKDTGARP